jgi:hypothetical protein
MIVATGRPTLRTLLSERRGIGLEEDGGEPPISGSEGARSRMVVVMGGVACGVGGDRVALGGSQSFDDGDFTLSISFVMKMSESGRSEFVAYFMSGNCNLCYSREKAGFSMAHPRLRPAILALRSLPTSPIRERDSPYSYLTKLLTHYPVTGQRKGELTYCLFDVSILSFSLITPLLDEEKKLIAAGGIGALPHARGHNPHNGLMSA